jgi:pimeloyl-ACP methyl ester carboxylesterase
MTHFDPTGFDCAAAGRIECPVFIITGELSPRLNLAICRELNWVITNSQLRMIPQSSHGLQLDNPAGFNEAVSEFLSGLDPRSIN